MILASFCQNDHQFTFSEKNRFCFQACSNIEDERSTSPGRMGRMVATSGFSGLASVGCALASALATPATVSLDRGIDGLRHSGSKLTAPAFERWLARRDRSPLWRPRRG